MTESQARFPRSQKADFPSLTLASFSKNSDKKSFRTLTIRSRSNSEASSALISNCEGNIPPNIAQHSEAEYGKKSQFYEDAQHFYNSKHLIVFRPRARSVSSSHKNPMSENLASMMKMKEELLVFIAQMSCLLHNLMNKTNSELVSLNDGIHEHWLTFMSFLILMYNKVLERKQNDAEESSESCNPFEPRNANEKQISVKPLTLVLDLDETLVHSSKIRPQTEHEALIVNFSNLMNLLIIQVEQNNGTYSQVFVKRRPHLDIFLEKLSQEFNLIIFTASHMQYAEAAINLIDKSAHISQKFYRESCERVNKNQWVKDLRKINHDLSRIIFIDNEEIAASLQPGNLMCIKSWYDNQEDDELLKYTELLLKYVEEWKKSGQDDEEKKDVRNFISKQRQENLPVGIEQQQE